VNIPLSASLFQLDFFEPLPIQISVSEAPLTSDAGLLPLRQFDERIGLTKQLAAVLDDPRDPELTEHTFLEMVRSRVFGILAGYEDQNDHDTTVDHCHDALHRTGWSVGDARIITADGSV
jgi:Transposase DDE domain group 1